MSLFRKIRSLSWAQHQKRWFAKWHLYLGIIAGAIVAFTGLTGSILVFQDEIDRALNPELFRVTETKERMTLDEIIPVIRKNYPDLKINYIMRDQKDDPALAYRVFNFKTEEETFINPYTGIMSGKRIHESSFIHIVTDLHTSLLVPVAGRYIVGLATLCLLILTISGLRLWIPKKWKQIKQVLTVKFSAGFKRQNYDWHNILGFYSAPVVAVLSVTGVCMTFSIVVIPLLFVFNGQSPQGVSQLLGAKSAYTRDAVQLPLNKIMQIAAKEIPEGSVAGIALPSDSTGNFRLDILSPDVVKTGKREMLVIDQYTGKVLINSRRDFPDVGDAYLSWLGPLHFGTFGGLPTQILALLGGLMPLVLFVTGFIIWWPRFKKQRNKGIRAGSSADTVPARREYIHVHTAEEASKWKYFIQTMKSGFGYALWFILISAVMGALYGVISGIVIQPAVFTIAFCTILIAMNFAVSVICILFNTIFLLPFRKSSRSIIRYFALSLSFMLIHAAAYILLLNTGMEIF